ncbi:hypothetical protein EV200_101547 [Pedobacter psychrotolerans]|uniref:Glycerophosphoryl diester phosphodiesterase family protein n=1 Tax=Pedobacter psychrotolerans TaxID=1843235 RepID=A0A4R2HLU7_9SPHI|nr:hypothetical protein [Pedobacter psychrotolerans]TCO31100.1 hypothetical protein EV200_101547 [Pedobacter psychrotolerans]GGE42213.1 hypothetical protein GCM10011413_05140 [Pedobacter psychrotolerans]
MINYLKESTFAVNDVIRKAWSIMTKHYFSIATLCFLMFITASASSLMAFFIKDVSKVLSFFMVIIFIMLYFTINLSLFKYIFHLIDNEDEDVTIVGTLPTRQQIIRFLVATLYFIGCILFIGLILFPILYVLDPVLRYLVKIGWVESFQTTGVVITQIAVGIAILALFITWLRISFFPFFIIDKNAPPFESIKLSLAITKGNFTKILLLLLVLGGGYLIYLFFNLLHWPFVAFIVNILSSFIIVPLSSVALTVAYRKIAGEYKGDEHPDILHNIV